MGEGEPNPEGIKLLIDHSHTITPEMVIGQLEREPYFQYQYIRALREREGGFLEDWGDLQVQSLVSISFPISTIYFLGQS